MHEHGIHVLRWVERMNRPDPSFSAAHAPEENYLDNDEIPDTLLEILRHMAIDFVPETKATCDELNEWIDSQSELVFGTTVERTIDGIANFYVEGTSMSSALLPYRFYLLKRLQDYVAESPAGVKKELIQLLESVSMLEILETKLSRNIGRANNLEVWE
jgi:hypothetical protein